MRAIVFKADLFSSEGDRARSEAVLQILLSALVASNVDFLTRHPRTPSLYKSGVRYRREEGTEEWKAIPDILRDRFGDCEDLASWRVAELRRSGIDARPFLRYKKSGDFSLYHVLVRYADGRFEDPSKLLGMGGDA